MRERNLIKEEGKTVGGGGQFERVNEVTGVQTLNLHPGGNMFPFLKSALGRFI